MSEAKMKKIVWLLSFVFFTFAPVVYAQTNVVAPPGVNEQISVHMIPEKPEPNENVTINIESFATNLSKAYIVWSVNDVVKKEGAGETSFNLTSGKAGFIQIVNVDITTEDRRSISHSIRIAPAKVD